LFTSPNVQEFIDIARNNKKNISSIDLKQGYDHSSNEARACEKTSIRTGGLSGKLHYCVLLYEFMQGVQVFKRTIEKILSGMNNKKSLIYCDDIFIFAETFNKLFENLNYVIGRISGKDWSINLGKSKFLVRGIDLLDHTTGANVSIATKRMYLPSKLQKANMQNKNIKLSCLSKLRKEICFILLNARTSCRVSYIKGISA
jgi:hypothetical protein